MELNYFDYWQLPTMYGDYGWFNYHYSDKFQKRCPFCDTELALVQGKWQDQDVCREHNKALDKQCNENLSTLDVRQCQTCGWWQVLRIQVEDDRNNSRGWFTQATTKSAALSSVNIPTDELAAYLVKNESRIFNIHHKKMEELVGSVFSKHYNCEVIHCGQSHDRGIDLLLVLSDDIIPIQVKRRQSPGQTESVSVIREMLGVMLRDERRKAIIVSTADRFSNDAQRDTAEVLRKGLVTRFDLVNFANFMSLLRQHYSAISQSYYSVIPETFGGKILIGN